MATLAISETISWGILYYSFAVFLPAMALALDSSQTAVSGALVVAVGLSAVAGVPIGRHLDRHAPRALLTGGSVAAVVCVVAWSQVGALWQLYAVFTAVGIVMAIVLYEPAFVVIAKALPDPARRRRGITAVTLVAALASFIFLPLAQALLDAHGWRDAVLVLAAILAITVPLHLQLPATTPATPAPSPGDAAHGSSAWRAIVRRTDFQLLTTSYALANLASLAPLVVTIPYLAAEGYSTAFAAFAVGLIGAAQLPGRIIFSLAEPRLSQQQGVVAIYALIAGGLALLIVASSTAVVVAAVVLLGTGKGMTTLSRPIVLADRFGTRDYGTIASITAAATTGVGAVSPLIATATVALAGTRTLLAALVGCAAVAALCLAPIRA